jgi:hypothetical protein
MGGGDVEYPEPTTEETTLQRGQGELLNLQTAMLRRAAQEQQALAPYFYRQYGLSPQYGPSGELTGFTEDPNFAADQARMRELQREQLGLSQEQVGLSQEQVAAQREMLPVQTEAQRSELERNIELQRRQGLLDPTRYAEAGLTPEYDAEGNITGFTDTSGLGGQSAEIQRLAGQRTLAALKGELPMDPALMRDLAEREQLTREGLRRQLGTGFETSTPGSEALQDWETTRFETLDKARRNDMTLAQTVGAGAQGAQINRLNMLGSFGPKSFLQASTLAGALGGGGGGAGAGGMNAALAGIPALGMAASGGFEGAYKGFNQVMGQLEQNRGGQFQADVSNQQAQQQRNQMYAGMAATSAMVAATAASARSLKREIRVLGPDEEAKTLGELMGYR